VLGLKSFDMIIKYVEYRYILHNRYNQLTQIDKFKVKSLVVQLYYYVKEKKKTKQQNICAILID
jgi:hypothetical protein